MITKKTLLDILNKERSLLADLTRVKLTKILDEEKIKVQKARVDLLIELMAHEK